MGHKKRLSGGVLWRPLSVLGDPVFTRVPGSGCPDLIHTAQYAPPMALKPSASSPPGARRTLTVCTDVQPARVSALSPYGKYGLRHPLRFVGRQEPERRCARPCDSESGSPFYIAKYRWVPRCPLQNTGTFCLTYFGQSRRLAFPRFTSGTRSIAIYPK